ncbi:MAG: glycosyltransferase [Dermatophilaceae bacterium]|nr:glycosyltransferase [Intrasporangiaceae bacterium]
MKLLSRLRTELWHFRKGGVAQWRLHRQRRAAVTRLAASPATPGNRPRRGRRVPEWPLPDRTPRRSLTVGVVLDEFSELALRWEWTQVSLTPRGWRQQVADDPIELLFVESAWNGGRGLWQYQLTGSGAPSQALRELVDWCRARGVPTVFWNKEDPVHFDDFIDSARLFDHVMTTDSACVPHYVETLGHDRVEVLPFAAAAWIHNPMRPGGPPDRDVAFAGMYFAHRYPERREQMNLLLGAADDVSSRLPTGLEIFSRFLGGDPRYQFPPPLDARVVGSLSYPQMLTAYREFAAFINVSSVPDSETMCPRRVFEISACATPVLATPTPALTRVFEPDEVLLVSDPEDARWAVRAVVTNSEWRDRMGVRASRRVLREHTYRHRVDDVLRRAGLERAVSRDPTVSVVVSSNRPEQSDHVLRTVASQRDVSIQLVLLGHGHELDADLAARARESGIADVVVLHAPADATLGDCLNRCVEAADGVVVTKMDDDDEYGPDYVGDQVRALDFSGAQVVGKHAHHVRLVEDDLLLLRFPAFENRSTHFVMGPTLMAHRDLVRAYPFAPVGRGEDTDFLHRVVADCGQVYASDRFGFIQVRRDRGHSWRATKYEFLATSRLLGRGVSASTVFV